MPIYALGDRTPSIHDDAFIHPDAVIIGDVRVGANSSVWPSAVLRGDYGTVIVANERQFRMAPFIHAVPDFPTVIGDDCVIGHLAHLEGVSSSPARSWAAARSCCIRRRCIRAPPLGPERSFAIEWTCRRTPSPWGCPPPSNST